jgi:ankyrin repeat protein
METYLKLGSIKKDNNCNCISPFYINGITGINPITKREYSPEDMDAMKTALYRISNAKGCTVDVCCDPNDPNSAVDPEFTKKFKQTYPKIMPIYQGSQLTGIKLSTSANVEESGWQDPTPHMICKITKATIKNTDNPNIKMAVNLVRDCFTDSCNGGVDMITVDTLLQNAKADLKYTYFDDARVSQSILEGNISYVKEYIRKYKNVDQPLTNDDYNNRLIHIASGSNHNDILEMLISLKANLNIRNKDLETPIHFAVRIKNIDNISSLLSQGIDLTIPNKNGETPMFLAMHTGDLRIINMLYSNNSPLFGIDKDGNNLIHYCVLNCPTYSEDDETVPNSKGEIIQFLIDRGISTEQKNKAGITPLELVSKQINREINKQCADRIQKEQAMIQEAFFGGSPQPTLTMNPAPTMNPTTTMNQIRRNAAMSNDLSGYTPEHISLLDVQTKIFNNILRNNPDKYNGYISVADLPAGAPIEVLDTVCVGGTDITGNEDSEECIAKGGRLSKIKNKTTKIKLELMPEEQSAINAIPQKDLYYPKINNKIPVGTIPGTIASYNASIKSSPTLNNNNNAKTTGMTYSIGTTPTNTAGLDIPSEPSFNPQPTQPGNTMETAIPSTTTTTTTTTTANNAPVAEHAAMIPEDNTIVRKCKLDAIQNSSRLNNTKESMSDITGSSNNSNSTMNKEKQMKMVLLIVGLFILIGLIYILFW